MLAAAVTAGLLSAAPTLAAHAEVEPDPAPASTDLLPTGPIDPGPHLVEFALPNPHGAPNDVVAGPDGSVWVSVFNDKQILRVSHDGAVLATAQLTGGPTSLTTDDAGGVWATEYASNAIAHVDASAAVTEHSIPTPNSFPANIDVFKGYVYFTESNTQKLGRYNPANGALDEYPILGSVTPWDVRGDQNTGSLYITDTGSGTVWKRYLNGEDQGTFAPAAGTDLFGDLTDFEDTVSTGYTSHEISTVNATDAFAKVLEVNRREITGVTEIRTRSFQLWFADAGDNVFGTRIDGSQLEFAMPTANVGLSGIAATGDRYLWSAEKVTGKLARLDVAATIPPDRLSGTDRYATAAAIAKGAYPAGASIAFVTSGETFADALSAGPIAAHNEAPVLLSTKGVLSSAARAELLRLNPGRVVLIGGPAALSDGVLASIQEALPRAAVQRIGGSDRFAVSRALLNSDLAPRGSEKVFISTGRDFPDALSAAPVAAHAGSVVLLVDGKSTALSGDEMRAIATQLSPMYGVPQIVGGPNAVSTAIENQLRSTYKLTYRYNGSDRFEVSSALNKGWVSGQPAYVASGISFPDALAGGAVAGAQHRPIYLSQKSCIPAAAVDAFVINRAPSVTVLGGLVALSAEVERLTSCR
ncbi:cell wall-binding repeat-containing protein [Herbiconiux flava]|uniref:Putative cell wall-binding protein/streptogramin lyase n=1 Tax=Herbiconiux flava TaxID=881268 RepID=A0A852S8D0_9MICO|nr:cell wall-binding repeat-containing protein [Herbiconiux flava]NYD69518.1 putative cell wall-binding protein/streptogramin lyase [Herbiconiux flava]GLK16264.1 hypothetical protein GCM10017602_07460 [Herbiconiux flava]